MKKKLVLILFLVVGIMVLAVPIAAQTNSNTGDAVNARPALAIKTPQIATVGQEVRFKVVDRNSGNPVAKAGLWAVNFNDAGKIPATSAAAMADIGVFLGWSDGNGDITHIFKEADWYLLVAVKDTYLPGFAWIFLQSIRTLAIKAPETAVVGEKVLLTVYEKQSSKVVAGAGVWALLAPNAATPTTSNTDIVSAAMTSGIYLGQTNDLGQVTHAFTRSGRYLLVAVKDGYIPSFNKITIKEAKELVIKAPETARIMEPVSIRVLEKSVLTVEIPVPKAAVWAVSMNTATTSNTQDFAVMAEKYGFLLGWTDEKGYVSPTPHFEKPGPYWLVALKDGYAPGVSKIQITPLLTATPVPLTN